MAKRLTDVAIRNLRPGVTRREIPDGGARGLYAVLQPSGRRSFAVRYRLHGKPQKFTLGEEGKPPLSLAEARRLAAAALADVAKGIDPAATKKAARVKAIEADKDTLAAVCAEYMRRKGNTLRSARERQRILDRWVLPTLGARQVATITRRELTRLLDRVEDESQKRSADGGKRNADSVLAILRAIFNWHAARGDDFNSPIVRGMARVKPSESARSRTLTDDEIRAVWHAADSAGVFGSLVKFLLLTSSRLNEAARMTRDELTGSDWLLPASRNKAKFDLLRPLSAAAMAVIEAQPRVDGCPFVFHTDGVHAIAAFSRFKRQLDEASGVHGWVLHDLRRCARSLMSRAGVNVDHAERVLGHVIGGVRGVYDRHEFYSEKKAALEALAAQIDRIVNPPAGSVVALRA
jgi:integrase